MALQKKKASTQKDIDSLNKGDKTLGTILKNKDDVGGLARTVEGIQVEI